MTSDEIREFLVGLTNDELVDVSVLLEHERIRRYGRRSEWMAAQGVPAGEAGGDR